LSSASQAAIEIDSLHDGEDYNTVITKAKFESLNEKHFLKCLDCVKHVLKDAKMVETDIDDVVLVGGSTRIPRVQALLQDFFGGKELCKSINPDEAVAYGAAVQGAILSGRRNAATSQLLLVDVTPLSLGIECVGKVMSTLIKRNTPIPVRKTKVYTTESDYQTILEIPIYEGERANVDGNNKLGEFTISGIERAKRGIPQVQVTFDIDACGILNVSAKDIVTGVTAQTTITNDTGRLSPEDIERMVNEAKKYAEEDAAFEKRHEARNTLEMTVYQLREVLIEQGITASGRMTQEVEEVQEWLQGNPDASVAEILKTIQT
jgi:L1 cell adhesion molecule like protein